ncbi:MAG: hypothetical protein M3P14_07575 [Chloroflexota bacterium]|nr:hypothetical protein [Chloroflexota bacterium]
MSEFFESGSAGTAATWIAALATLAVWSYLAGERRLLRAAQLLLAGLATGYLALVAIREVLVPQLLSPVVNSASAHPELLVDLVLVTIMAGALYLPRRLVAGPAAVVVGGTAGFALGGAVTGTLLPQLAAGIVNSGSGAGGAISGIIGLAITVPVLLAFLHGTPRGAVVSGAARAGRWFIVGGLGAWLGFLLLSRLSLLVDRIGFLLGDWLGLLR